MEVVLLDSGSTDGTLSIAGRYPVRRYIIPREPFTYSGTLNAGVSLVRGRFFVPLSGHAVPTNGQWLDELVAPLVWTILL